MSSPAEVAIAILHQNGQFLMQLRDNNPNIFYPGHWAFFGGHLESGEHPDAGVRRELLEEIGYAPDLLAPFNRYDSPTVIRHVYVGRLDIEVTDLRLNEGWDLGLLTPDEVRQGEAYSDRAGQMRPLGQPHQQILLDFMAQTIERF